MKPLNPLRDLLGLCVTYLGFSNITRPKRANGANVMRAQSMGISYINEVIEVKSLLCKILAENSDDKTGLCYLCLKDKSYGWRSQRSRTKRNRRTGTSYSIASCNSRNSDRLTLIALLWAESLRRYWVWVLHRSKYFFQSKPHEFGISNQVELPHTLWFLKESIKPFQSRILHPNWCSLCFPCHQIKASTHSAWGCRTHNNKI